MNHQLLDGNRVSHGLFDLRAYAQSQTEASANNNRYHRASPRQKRASTKGSKGLNPADIVSAGAGSDSDDDEAIDGVIASQVSRFDTGIELKHTRDISNAL